MRARNFTSCYNKILIIFCLLGSKQCYANINAVDFKKVHYPSELETSVSFLKENIGLYDHWVHDWVYQVKKETVIQTLSGLYDGIDKIQDKNVETDLLLGDISHYLYNLELEQYYKKSVENYIKAQQLAPDDYRVYWFLANHYALSDQPSLSIKIYKTAFDHKPEKDNAFFWFDYSAACFPAGMRSTALFALEKSYEIQPSAHLQDLISKIKETIKYPSTDSLIEAKKIWSVAGKQDNKIVFTNRVVGLKLSIDSNWGIQPGNIDKGTLAVTFKPTTIVSRVNNQGIDYSMLVLAKAAKPNQSLKEFMTVFSSKYSNIKSVQLTTKYKNCITYEINEPSIYKNIGGGHMYMLAIEREEPDYPGMALETAGDALGKDHPGLTYYKVASDYTRLKGKIYYLVLLDTCGYIHEESLAIFKDFLQNGLLIE